MIFTDFHFYSETLGIQTAVYILLPDKAVLKQSDKPLPVLYLLHGLSDDHTMWMRQTRLEQYARRYRVAIVMPAVNRSFYMDMAHGAKYDSFIAQELPALVESYFPVSQQREDRFAAGLSMGGYGALKLGLSRPGRYAAVASFSGALRVEDSYDARSGKSDEFLRELDDAFGGEQALHNGHGNLSALAKRLAETPEKSPRIYISCGTEDFLFETNERFVRDFGKLLPIEYHTEPGAHTWDFWDKHIERVLRWLPLERAQGVW